MKYSILSFLLFHALSYGQQVELNQMSIDTIRMGPDACHYIPKIKKVLDKDPTIIAKTKLNLHKSYCFLLKRENDSTVFYANKTIETYTLEKGSIHADGLIHKAYYILGLRQYFDKDPLNALITLNEALRLAKKFPESPDMISWKDYIYTRIAIIHQEMGDYNLALEAEREALKDSTRMVQKYEGGGTYLRIGNLHEYLKNIDSAKIYTKKALTIIEDSTLITEKHYKYESLLKISMMSYYDLGKYALLEGKKDSAIHYFKKSYNIYGMSSLKENVKKSLVPLTVKTGYAYVLMHENKLNQSIQLLEKVLDSLNIIDRYSRGKRDLLIESSSILTSARSKNGDYKKAIGVQKSLNDYLLAYNENKISEQLQFYTTAYKVQEKDESIKNLSQKRDAQQLVIVKRNTAIGSIITGFILLLMGWYFFNKRRQLHQKYKLVNLEQRLLRSQLNPHFLFNALNNVMVLSSQKSKNTESYILKLSALLRRILENSREEFIFLDKELEAIKDYLELESDFSQKFTFSIKVAHDIDREVVLVPPMFIQPFVENSIRHGFQGEGGGNIEISISINEEENQIYYKISDNGIGYSRNLKFKSNEEKSLSGKILKERLDLYSKAFKTKSYFNKKDLDPKGTEINVALPYLIDS